MHERSIWLPLQIAAGVALGIVVGGVVLHQLWLYQMRMAVDEGIRAFQSAVPTQKGVVRSGPVVPVSRREQSAADACGLHEVRGDVNGQPVCVDRASGLSRRLGQ